jgi:hypothetical protein
VTIDGTLTSLNRNDVTTDPNTGRLVQRPEVRNQKSKFLTYGAGLGLLIGILTNNALKGALIGALAGYLAGTTVGEKTTYSDVVVPEGTQFGIALQQDITLVTSSGGGTGTGAGTGTGTGTGSGTGTGPGQVTPAWTVTFDRQMPYTTTGGVVMVPLRSVMDQVDQAFVYRASNRSISMNTNNGQSIQHRVGTRVAYVDGQPVYLRTASRIINGVLYVPSDFVSVVTGGNALWQPSTGSLVIYRR